jgi:hypothetical protein
MFIGDVDGQSRIRKLYFRLELTELKLKFKRRKVKYPINLHIDGKRQSISRLNQTD